MSEANEQTGKKLIAAFIGRFQPVHHGHVTGIQKLLNKHDEVYIAVASYPQTSKTNPLTPLEAKKLLVVSLIEAGVDMSKTHVSVIRQPKNYKSDSLFYIYAELGRRIRRPFTFYTGNKMVYDILSSRGLAVKFFERVSPTYHGKQIRLPKGQQLTSTLIRELIVGGQKWEHLLPFAAARIIKQQLINRIKRLRKKPVIHQHYK